MNKVSNNTQTMTLMIPNISCKHCVHTIKMELEEMEGVISIETDLETKTATIIFSPPANKETIVELLTEINYPPMKY